MIIRQYRKPMVSKYANYDYIQVYDVNDRFVGWIKCITDSGGLI